VHFRCMFRMPIASFEKLSLCDNISNCVPEEVFRPDAFLLHGGLSHRPTSMPFNIKEAMCRGKSRLQCHFDFLLVVRILISSLHLMLSNLKCTMLLTLLFTVADNNELWPSGRPSNQDAQFRRQGDRIRNGNVLTLATHTSNYRCPMQSNMRLNQQGLVHFDLLKKCTIQKKYLLVNIGILLVCFYSSPVVLCRFKLASSASLHSRFFLRFNMPTVNSFVSGLKDSSPSTFFISSR